MNTGIRIRVLLLSLVPLLVFTLVIGYYMVVTRVQDVEQALRDRGETIARHLATKTEFSLFSEDYSQLHRIAEASLQEADVHEIRIRDASRRIVIHAGRQRLEERNGTGGDDAGNPDQEQILTFGTPVHSSSIAISDNQELLAEATEDDGSSPLVPIGWVEVGMSMEGTHQRQATIIRNIIMIASATALFSILIALWMGRGIVRPIIRLSHAVDDIRKGHLATRIEPSAGGEIGALERGFNDMAEVMEQSQQGLQSEVQDATAKLQSSIRELERKNRELDTARQKALVAGDEKANFLANMSHEIRTPINAILGYTAMLEKSGLSTDQYEYTRTIGCASTQLLRVIDDILSFSKLESGTVQPDSNDFDLRDLLEDVLCMMGPEAREKFLELVLLIDSEVPLKLHGDAVHLRQVVINLMSNAIKFTDRGGVNLQVSLAGHEDDRVELELRVIDSGIGIPREVVDRIFGTFHQADASISRRYGGTGLGLAIVSRLIGLWDGKIGVSSDPGDGSTFWFTFKAGLQSSQMDPAASPDLAGRKVLLYDDNPVACRAVRNLLLSWSMEVFLARRRDRIGEMLETARDDGAAFDIVVFGIGLNHLENKNQEPEPPELGGLVEIIRNQHRMPLLLMVNSRRTSLLSRSLSDRDLKIVIKPVRRDILHRNICTLLGVERAGDGIVNNEAANDPGEEPGEFYGLRMLLAEDNEFNRTLVTRLLEADGVEVFQVASGDEALELARVQDFDLVLMDLHLPGMDGIETTRRLRRLRPSLRYLPVIVLTADVFFNVPEKLREAEIDACLLKPLEEKELWKLIRALCLTPATENRKPRAPLRKETIRDQMKPRLHAAIREHQQRLAKAAAKGDYSALVELVHELKGVVGYFGLNELTGAVDELESRIGPDSDIADIVQSVERFGWIIEKSVTQQFPETGG